MIIFSVAENWFRQLVDKKRDYVINQKVEKVRLKLPEKILDLELILPEHVSISSILAYLHFWLTGILNSKRPKNGVAVEFLLPRGLYFTLNGTSGECLPKGNPKIYRFKTFFSRERAVLSSR